MQAILSFFLFSRIKHPIARQMSHRMERMHARSQKT